jgi:hypothetical protein
MGFELKGLGTLWVCLGFFLWVGFGTSCVLKGVLHILIKLFLLIKKKKKKKLPITFIMDLQTDGGSNYFGVE